MRHRAQSLASLSAMTETNPGLVAECGKKYGVALRRSKAGLCKAGESELKSSSAIGRMLKRK